MSRRYSSESVSSGTIKYASSQKYCASESAAMSRAVVCFSSPLGVYDFVKRTSFVQFSKDALKADVEAITTLAREEGLEAHARAVESRFGKEDF